MQKLLKNLCTLLKNLGMLLRNLCTLLKKSFCPQQFRFLRI
jgi:hypothetical protein